MSDASVFNMDEALERVDHDRETFQMMSEIFLEQGPKDLQEAQVALAGSNDRDEVVVELEMAT